MNQFEAACREWIKGCSCAPKGEPWRCEACTEAFASRIRELAEADQDLPAPLD